MHRWKNYYCIDEMSLIFLLNYCSNSANSMGSSSRLHIFCHSNPSYKITVLYSLGVFFKFHSSVMSGVAGM